MKLVERLHLFIKYNNLNLSEFDKSIGAANGYIGKQIKNKGSIGSHIIESIFSYYPQLNVQWLMTGEGEMIKNVENNIKSNIELANPTGNATEKTKLSIINLTPKAITAIAETFNLTNNPDEINNGVYALDPKNNTLINSVQYEKFLCVQYKGRSMFPTIKDSTYLIIQNLHELVLNQNNANGVLIIFTVGGIHIGRLEENGKTGFIILARDNVDRRKYPNIKIQNNEIISLWRIEGYINSEQARFDIPEPNPKSIASLEEQLHVLETALIKLKTDVATKSTR